MTEQEIKAIHAHFEKFKERELGIRECFIDDVQGEKRPVPYALPFLDATAAVLLNLFVPLMTENRYTPLFHLRFLDDIVDDCLTYKVWISNHMKSHLREFRRKYLDVTMQSRFDDMRTSFAENITL